MSNKTTDAEFQRLVNGVPYSEAPKPDPYRIVPTGKGLVNGINWITDGYIAFEGEAKDTVKELPIQTVVPSTFSEDVYPVAYFPHTVSIAVLSNGALVNYDMFSKLHKTFKKSVIKANGKLSPIAFIKDNRTVAIMVPINLYGMNLPENVRQILSEVGND